MKIALLLLCLVASVNLFAFENAEYIPLEEMGVTYFEDGTKGFGLNGGCKRYSSVRQCQNQRVCRMVCSGASAGVAGAVCNEVCSMVPKCSNVIVCVEYY